MTAGAGDRRRAAQREEWRPLGAAASRRQIDGLLRILGPRPRRVLDLGCGDGRVLVPLAGAGHHAAGIDRDPEALDAVRRRLGAAALDAELREGDFTGRGTWPTGPFDAVLCLGNTFMTISDVDAAARLLRQVRRALAAGGRFVTDDCPRAFWPELTGGNWQTGIAPDGGKQIVWSETDAVFALRRGDEIDSRAWRLRPGDRCCRLWTDGALRLAARAGGLSAPERHEGASLVSMRRGHGGEGG